MAYPIDLAAYVRTIPDYPIPGANYSDISPLLHSPQAFQAAVDAFVERYRNRGIDAVIGVESRGYLFAAPLAYLLGVNLSIIRTAGRLPAATYEVENYLHFGDEKLQIHRDAIRRGSRVVLVEDILATGTTTLAACELINMAGGQIEELAFLVEFKDHKGRMALGDRPVFALVEV
jgi:adenine phosphoribosyltransferase